MTSNENIVWHHHHVDKEQRSKQKGQRPCVLWFTGLSGSGKSTIAGLVEQKLFSLQQHTYLLDGDNVRHGLCGDLGFSDTDRVENIRRIGETAKLFIDAGLIVITAFISPFKADRQLARNLLQQGEFVEVFVDTSIDECEKRDPKGLYKKARNGDIANFTGIHSDYEAPETAEVHLKTEQLSAEQAAEQVVAYLQQQGYITHA